MNNATTDLLNAMKYIVVPDITRLIIENSMVIRRFPSPLKKDNVEHTINTILAQLFFFMNLYTIQKNNTPNMLIKAPIKTNSPGPPVPKNDGDGEVIADHIKYRPVPNTNAVTI